MPFDKVKSMLAVLGWVVVVGLMGSLIVMTFTSGHDVPIVGIGLLVVAMVALCLMGVLFFWFKCRHCDRVLRLNNLWENYCARCGNNVNRDE